MKKLMILTSTLALFATAKSQQLSFGPTVGFGHTWMSHTNGTQRFNPSYNAGLSMVYSSQTHWGFSADVKYSTEGDKSEVVNEGATVVNNVNINYVRVPLKAIYFFGKYGSAVRPKIAVGPSFGFMTNGNIITNVDGEQAAKVSARDYYKTFDIGGLASAGLNFRIAPKTWLNTDVSYYHGFTDVNKADNGAQRNRGVGVNLGVAVGLGK